MISACTPFPSYKNRVRFEDTLNHFLSRHKRDLFAHNFSCFSAHDGSRGTWAYYCLLSSPVLRDLRGWRAKPSAWTPAAARALVPFA